MVFAAAAGISPYAGEHERPVQALPEPFAEHICSRRVPSSPAMGRRRGGPLQRHVGFAQIIRSNHLRRHAGWRIVQPV